MKIEAAVGLAGTVLAVLRAGWIDQRWDLIVASSRFKNTLVSLDATVIDLCAEMFEWATFRRTKGAVKLHLTLDHDGDLPTALVITEGKRHEVTVARQQTCAPGTILVMDRGYLDFAWFAQLTETGVVFVTRMKDNTAYTVVAARSVPTRGGVVTDAQIILTGPLSATTYDDRKH